jgi:hypothetical protein
MFLMLPLTYLREIWGEEYGNTTCEFFLIYSYTFLIHQDFINDRSYKVTFLMLNTSLIRTSISYQIYLLGHLPTVLAYPLVSELA